MPTGWRAIAVSSQARERLPVTTILRSNRPYQILIEPVISAGQG